MVISGCCVVIAFVNSFDIDHPLIATICDGPKPPERLVAVVNFPRPQGHVAPTNWDTARNGTPIHVIEIADYLGSAGAFLRGMEQAVMRSNDCVILFDEDCTVDALTCAELAGSCTANSPFVSGNRNGRGDGRVSVGLLFALKKTPHRSNGALVTWAGTALYLHHIPRWHEWLETLSQTLWFYWDDYVFSAWATAEGIRIETVASALFYSPNPARRNRAGWRYYYEARNAVWFAKLTMPLGRRMRFTGLWFLEFVLGFGLRDRKLAWAWSGFWDGMRGVRGRTHMPTDTTGGQ